jgi:hypothetical protein
MSNSMSIVQVVPLHTNIISVKLILYTNVEKQDEGFITLQGRGGSGLSSRLQDLLLSGRCSGGRSGRQTRVEGVGPPTRRPVLRWALGTVGSRRGCRTSGAAGGGLHQRDGQQVFSKVADRALIRGDGQWLLQGDGRAKSGVAQGAAARRLGRLLGRWQQERYGSRTPLCCEVGR